MLLEVDGLTKTYRNGTTANDGITLSIEPGEVFGLLGPNGAGKTTLVAQLLGLAKPTSGSIRLDGVDIVENPAFARQECSYQPQATVPTTGLTPIQAVELCGRIRGGSKAAVLRRARELLESLDLQEWERKLTPLSGGVARLVSFCMAAVQPGRLVILDEPTNDVDPLRRRLLWQQIRALASAGSGVLLVTHNVLEAERCVDRLAILDAGRVVRSGSPASMKEGMTGSLRLELVLEPDASPPALPGWAARPVAAGTRMMSEVSLADCGAAVSWAAGAKAEGLIAEFSIVPVSLEDVYVRTVSGEPEPGVAPTGLGAEVDASLL